MQMKVAEDIAIVVNLLFSFSLLNFFLDCDYFLVNLKLRYPLKIEALDVSMDL